MPIQAGTTFRAPRSEVPGKRHPLFIVISDPLNHPDAVLVVNVTSFRPNADQSCILEATDHPDLDRKSRIAYEYVRAITTTAKLNDALRAELAELRQPVSGLVLRRIRKGALVSGDLASKYKRLLIAQDCASPTSRT